MIHIRVKGMKLALKKGNYTIGLNHPIPHCRYSLPKPEINRRAGGVSPKGTSSTTFGKSRSVFRALDARDCCQIPKGKASGNDCYIAIENGHRNIECSQWKWWFYSHVCLPEGMATNSIRFLHLHISFIHRSADFQSETQNWQQSRGSLGPSYLRARCNSLYQYEHSTCGCSSVIVSPKF